MIEDFEKHRQDDWAGAMFIIFISSLKEGETMELDDKRVYFIPVTAEQLQEIPDATLREFAKAHGFDQGQNQEETIRNIMKGAKQQGGEVMMMGRLEKELKTPMTSINCTP